MAVDVDRSFFLLLFYWLSLWWNEENESLGNRNNFFFFVQCVIQLQADIVSQNVNRKKKKREKNMQINWANCFVGCHQQQQQQSQTKRMSQMK